MIKTLHYTTFLLLRMAETIMAALPRKFALFLGNQVGLLLFYTGFRKNVIRKNMEHVNLCLSSEMNAIIKKTYCTSAKYAVDFLRYGKKPPFTINNFELINKLLEQNRGLISILAHFGNWEIMADLFGARVSHLSVIAKTMSNPYTQAWVEKKRSTANVETIYRENALRKILKVLSQNGIIAILIDQYAGKHGSAALFLDKKASTVKTIAGIVQKNGCPVVAAYALMRQDATYEIIIDEVPTPDTTGLSNEEIIVTLQNHHNFVLSSWIRKYPEHYFGWFHKRFKGQITY